MRRTGEVEGGLRCTRVVAVETRPTGGGVEANEMTCVVTRWRGTACIMQGIRRREGRPWAEGRTSSISNIQPQCGRQSVGKASTCAG